MLCTVNCVSDSIEISFRGESRRKFLKLETDLSTKHNECKLWREKKGIIFRKRMCWTKLKTFFFYWVTMATFWNQINFCFISFFFMLIYKWFCIPFNNMLTRDKCNSVDMWRSIIFIFLIISILIGLTWEIEPHQTKPIKHSV